MYAEKGKTRPITEITRVKITNYMNIYTLHKPFRNSAEGKKKEIKTAV